MTLACAGKELTKGNLSQKRPKWREMTEAIVPILSYREKIAPNE